VRSRARYEHLRQSIVEHLKSKNEGKPVAIRRIEHLIPDFVAFNEGDVALTDPQLYRVLLDQPIVASPAQELPNALPETIPPPKAELAPETISADGVSSSRLSVRPTVEDEDKSASEVAP
jgi:hypothetical protein